MPVAGLPACGELGDQLVLADGGVLELVDEQVPDAVVEREREIARRLRAAQREQRALRDLGEIDLAARLEHELQLRRRARKQPHDRSQHFPLVITVFARRKLAHLGERQPECVMATQLVEERKRALLPGLRRLPGGKALVFRETAAPIALIGQEQSGKHGPVLDAAFEFPAPEVGEGMAGDRRPLRARVRRQEIARAIEHAASLGCERGLEPHAPPSVHVAQPVITAPEHLREQPLDAADVVVEMREQALDVLRERLVALDHFEGCARRLHVERLRVLDALRLRAEAREHRHLARQRRAQRVDGLDAQARRVIADTPSPLDVARERRGRKLERRALMPAFRRFSRARLGEGLEHALAHLARGLARERDGDDLLGMFDEREQAQIALDQEPGLARARGRLHDEGASRVQRAQSLFGIGRVLHRPSSSCQPLPASAMRHRQASAHRGHC